MKKRPHKHKISPIETETLYVEFLRKRMKSDNYTANVSDEEFKKTKAKYDKAKLKLKYLVDQDKHLKK